MTAQPVQLRWPTEGEAHVAAHLLTGNDPQQWIAELIRWQVPLDALRLLVLPKSIRSREPAGVLVISNESHPFEIMPGVLPYAQVAPHVYAPQNAVLYPPLSDAERAAMFSGHLYVFQPSIGLIGFEREDELSVADLFEPLWFGLESWDQAKAGSPPPRKLSAIRVHKPLDISELFQGEVESIGADDPVDLPPAPFEKQSAGVFGKLRDWSDRAIVGIGGRMPGVLSSVASMLLFAFLIFLLAMVLTLTHYIGAQLGLTSTQNAILKAVVLAAVIILGLLLWRRMQRRPSRIGTARPVYESGASGTSGGNWLSNWFTKKRLRVSENLQKRRNRELERLLHLMETNLDEGLRYALPIAGTPGGLGRGVAAPSGFLSKRLVNFSLSGLGGGYATDHWDASAYYQRLRKQYLDAANREITLKRYRRAGYIYAELLGDFNAAGRVLEQGGYYREAAALYKQHLNNPRMAAQCLLKGGLLTEALEEFRQLEMHLEVGDIYRLLDQDAEAEQAYRRELVQRLAREDYLASAELLVEKLDAREEALGVLDRAWPHSSQAVPSAWVAFELRGQLGRHQEATNIVRSFHDAAEPKLQGKALDVLRMVHEAYPDQRVKRTARDSIYTLGSALLSDRQADSSPAIHALKKLYGEDRLLPRDLGRFARQQQKSAHQTKPLSKPDDASGLKLCQTYPLSNVMMQPLACDTIDDVLFVAGIKPGEDRLAVQHCQQNEPSGTLTWKGYAPDTLEHLTMLAFRKGVLLLLPGAAPERRFGLRQVDPWIGTPPWLPNDVYRACWSAHGELWTLRCDFDTGLWSVWIYSAAGEQIGSKNLDDVQELLPQFDRHSCLCVQDRKIRLAGGDVLLIERPDSWFSMSLRVPLIDIAQSRANTRQRLIVGLEEGAALVWPTEIPEPRLEYFATDIIAPKVAILSGGQIIAAGDNDARIYSTRSGTPRPLARIAKPAAPVAKVCAVTGGQFYIVMADGAILWGRYN